MNTGSEVINKLIGKYENEITMIYGKSATGKTTIAMLAAICHTENKVKVAFIDTERGFSIERFRQLGGRNTDHILLFNVNSFDEQHDTLLRLERLAGNIGIIIVDTIGMYYRAVLKDDYKAANRSMARQVSALSEICKRFSIPSIITNQVYTSIDDNITRFLGGNVIVNRCRKIIELQSNEHRKMILRKPESGEILFEIKEDGIYQKEK